MHVLICTLIAGVMAPPPGPDGGFTRAELMEIIASAMRSIGSVRCEFEAKFIDQATLDKQAFRIGRDPRDLTPGQTHQFSGTALWRPGAYNISLFEHDLRRDRKKTHRLSFDGKKKTSLITNLDGRYNDGQIVAASTRSFDVNCTMLDLWKTPSLLQRLSQPEVPEVSVVHEGGETVDGSRCEVVRLYYGLGNTRSAYTERFWVDLSECALVRRYESYEEDRLVSRLSGLKTRDIRDPLRPDTTIEFPFEGIYETFIYPNPGNASEMLHSDTPIFRVLLGVVTNSFALNKPISDQELKIVMPNGTMVFDVTNGRSYEVGQDLRDPPVTVEEAEARLAEYLRAAEASEGPLDASRWTEGTRAPWGVLATWTVALAAWVLLAVLLVRRRLAGKET